MTEEGFDKTEQALLRALQKPQSNLRGVRRGDLIAVLPHRSASSMTRQLRRLRALGLIKKSLIRTAITSPASAAAPSPPAAD